MCLPGNVSKVGESAEEMNARLAAEKAAKPPQKSPMRGNISEPGQTLEEMGAGVPAGTFNKAPVDDRPAPEPDLADLAVQEARRRQARLLGIGRGRRSTFLTGSSGLTGAGPLARQTLLGG